jgi:hypothetical protein
MERAKDLRAPNKSSDLSHVTREDHKTRASQDDREHQSTRASHTIESTRRIERAMKHESTKSNERARLDVTGLSSDVSDNRVLRIHFRNPVTEDDRRAVLKAINLENRASQPGGVDQDSRASQES